MNLGHRYRQSARCGALIASVLMLASCAPQAPAPTSPAAPTTAAAPAQPAPAAPAAASPAAAAPAASPAAAAPAASPAAAASGGSLVTMNLATGPAVNFAPWFMGIEKGIFVAHGLDTKARVFDNGVEMVKSMMANDADFTSNVIGNFLPALEQGLPLVALAVSTGDPTQEFSDAQMMIVARDGSGIKSIADLKGKKLGLTTSGTQDEYLQAVLNKNGIPTDQVERVNTPQGSLASTLQAARVDAIVSVEPYGTLCLETVPGAYPVVQGGGYLSYFGFLITTQSMIQSNPEKVQRTVDAIAEADQWTRQHPNETGEVLTRWVPGLQVNIAQKSMKYVMFDPRVSTQVMDAIEHHRQLLVSQKKVRSDLDVRKSIDLRFIQKTMQTHPEYFSDLKPVELAK